MPVPPAPHTRTSIPDLPRRLLQVLIVVGLAMELYGQQWLNAIVVTAILMLTVLPAFFARWAKFSIPYQFEVLAIIFIFASLYLGERRDFYNRFWWWDLALHSASGVLTGILGFLLVYVLNQDPRIEVHIKPFFVAFFAFCFATTVGTLWEVFEFTMDQLVGVNMQKPTFSDPSGLTDTMWDLIVNAIGSLAVVVYGYCYMHRPVRTTIEHWIERFIATNPRLFPPK